MRAVSKGMRGGRRQGTLSAFLRFIVRIAAVITVSVFVFLVGYILVKGVPHITLDLFAFKYTSENVSLFPALVNTITMTLVSLLIAVPLGIFAAIYLVEYAKRGNKFVGIIRTTAETLAGIPSIVYGLFGMLFFVTALEWSYSMLAGAFTLSIMILPLIIRTTEEALISVPRILTERAASALERAGCAQCLESCCPRRCRAYYLELYYP